MKNMMKMSVIALAIIAHGACSGMMTVYDKGATFDRHASLLPELKGKVYDNLDLKTQSSYLCTSKKNKVEGTERSKYNFFLAYTSQDPRVADNATIRPLKLLTRDYCGLGIVGVITPASESFYSTEAWKEYQNGEKPTQGFSCSFPAGLNLQVAHFPSNSYIGEEKKFNTQMILHAAMGNMPKLAECFEADSVHQSKRSPFIDFHGRSLGHVIDVAIHQKQFVPLSLALKAQNVHFNNVKDNAVKATFIRSEVCYAEKRIKNALKNNDLDLYRALIADTSYDVMIQQIPLCAGVDSNETLRNVVVDAKKQGLCTHEEITFFDKVKNNKFNSLYPNKRSDDQHCTIL